jgi:hypothetical protein
MAVAAATAIPTGTLLQQSLQSPKVALKTFLEGADHLDC